MIYFLQTHIKTPYVESEKEKFHFTEAKAEAQEDRWLILGYTLLSGLRKNYGQIFCFWASETMQPVLGLECTLFYQVVLFEYQL